MKILVTGGAGYIGSHTTVELLNAGYDVVIVDDFSNSDEVALENIKKITNKDFKFYEGNICNKEVVENIFKNEQIDGIIHFAGFKAVGESVEKPLMYYNNNLISTLNILEAMVKYNVDKIVFSSSATVYGKPEVLPIKEDAKLSTSNPYGTTKLMIEMILKDFIAANPKKTAIVLRYFNPVGAHNSGLLGENPKGIPNNLMPFIIKVAKGELKELSVFGNDYDTIDGTGVRDYIHVVDLSLGHIKALEKANDIKGIDYFNLGTGVGYSVLEMVNSFSKVNNVEVPYKIAPRRSGDIAECYADPEKSKKELNFVATHTLEDMCRDGYKFVENSSK